MTLNLTQNILVESDYLEVVSLIDGALEGLTKVSIFIKESKAILRFGIYFLLPRELVSQLSSALAC